MTNAHTSRLISGSLYNNRGPRITVADLEAAIDAHGGNQTHFAREVFGHTDGRQVRRWLAGGSMNYYAARKLADRIKETANTLNLFAKQKAAKRKAAK